MKHETERNHVALGIFFVLSVVSFSSCVTVEPSKSNEYESASAWSAKDLAAGPTELLKAPFSVLACPGRLTGKEVQGIRESHSGTWSLVGQSAMIPFRAIFDGAFTGIGYVAGGAIDTLTGGTLGVGAGSGEKEPNGSIQCMISGSAQ